MKRARKMLDELATLRALEGDMTLRRLQTLLIVYLAGDNGIYLSDIRKELDATGSNTTKLVQSWTKWTAKKEKGPGYMTSEPDPMDMKVRLVKITPKGRRFVDTILGEDGCSPRPRGGS